MLAKKYGVKVEEFGVGIPPRMWGKKIGETIYSINWIPLGGFVRLYGEDRSIDDERSFSTKPIYQRALIILEELLHFCSCCRCFFSIFSCRGSTVVSEEDMQTGEFSDEQVVIAYVLEESPAGEAGIEAGDIIKEVEGSGIKNSSEVISLIQESGGEEMQFKVDRGGKEISLSVTPKEEYEVEEGAVGIMMLSTAEKAIPFIMLQ